jgi:hypothetical protein
MKRLLFIIIAALGFTSCAHFHDSNVSVWAGGLWIIQALIAIGFFICVYHVWQAYNSGTVEGGGNDKPYVDYGKGVKPPMKWNGWLIFAIIAFVAFWVVVYAVNHGR